MNEMHVLPVTDSLVLVKAEQLYLVFHTQMPLMSLGMPPNTAEIVTVCQQLVFADQSIQLK